MAWQAFILMVHARALTVRFTRNSVTDGRPSKLTESHEGGVALVTKAVSQRNAPTDTIAATPATGLTNFLDDIVVALSDSFCILLVTGWCARHQVRRNVQ